MLWRQVRFSNQQKRAVALSKNDRIFLVITKVTNCVCKCLSHSHPQRDYIFWVRMVYELVCPLLVTSIHPHRKNFVICVNLFNALSSSSFVKLGQLSLLLLEQLSKTHRIQPIRRIVLCNELKFSIFRIASFLFGYWYIHIGLALVPSLLLSHCSQFVE